jgi:DNA repair protein RadC
MAYDIPLYTVQLVRSADVPLEEERACRTATHVYDIFKAALGDPDRECVLLLMLDPRRELLGLHQIAIGGMEHAQLSAREIFRTALLAGAAAIILAHNHVSGEPAPSDPDHNITFSLENAGMLLGVHLVDHVIVGHQKYFSFREEGLMRLPDPADDGGMEMMPVDVRGWVH